MANEEQEAWDALYDQKAGQLRNYFQKLDDPVKKGFILSALESIVGDMREGNVNFATGKRDRKIARDYMDEIGDTEIAKSIGRILDMPDQVQIKALCIHGSIVKIGRGFGVSADAIRQTKRRLLEDGAKSSYLAAQFAHWLLQQGYRVEK